MDQKRTEALDRYFRAANYLTVGQIYLKENPLLLEPLKKEHIKTRLLGHWGTSSGLNFIYAHLNRLIQDTKAEFLYVTGPGHGGPALRANVYLEGTMTEVYPDISLDTKGILKLMREFSWPGGVPSHVSPPTPGSIHEGGELGYSLVHAYGAAFDHPDLIVACIVGDGEAETGPLAASWHSNKFLNPARDGAVLPILHLNGYKISGPTVLGRMDDDSLRSYFQGLGFEVHFIEGSDPETMHHQFAGLLDTVYERIRSIQKEAKEKGAQTLFHFPMIIMRTPKGWTGPKVVDGKKIEGTFRSHQVPIADIINNSQHLAILEEWMKSYRPHELFDSSGKPLPEVLEIVPEDSSKMGKSPYANGGVLLKDLELPNAENYVLEFTKPGSVIGEATRNLGMFVRDVFKQNPNNFRLFCPDETNSNRFNHVFEVTDRMYIGEIFDWDENLSASGRVMEVLSEHLCQGWLEGYLLTGRHGLFPCYEAFALIVDSMLNQHAKWLKACLELPWRKPIASLNYILTSHAWRQDHNGYSHQGPGFIESVLSKKSTVARIYLPPDANTLLFITDHCLKSKNYVNLIIAGKQPMEQWLDKESALEHCKRGASVWEWASTSKDPEVVFAAAGDVPTKEILAAIDLLKSALPDIRIQMVNVLDLCTLSPPEIHPHGLDDATFNTLFPKEVPVIFAFHGHPRVIHELAYRRERGRGIHVRGYIEEGTTTTPFDMVVENGMSRYHLAMLALEHLPRIDSKDLMLTFQEKLKEHKRYIFEHGNDLPEIVNWQWKS